MDDAVKRFQARRDARLKKRLDEFNENDHPRDENGRFASGGGGGSAPKKKGGGKSSGENLFYMGSGGKKWDKEAVSKKFQERGYGKRTADKMAEVEIKEVLKKQKENWGTNDMEREAKRKSTEGGSTGGGGSEPKKESGGKGLTEKQLSTLSSANYLDKRYFTPMTEEAETDDDVVKILDNAYKDPRVRKGDVRRMVAEYSEFVGHSKQEAAEFKKKLTRKGIYI